TSSQTTYAIESSSSTGRPCADGVHAISANFVSLLLAHAVARSARPAARKLTTKRPVASSAGSVLLRLSTETRTSGGSAETEVKALHVRPTGRPSAVTVVTTVTP